MFQYPNNTKNSTVLNLPLISPGCQVTQKLHSVFLSLVLTQTRYEKQIPLAI